jgi:DNA end-binding protein Ku
MPHTLMNTAISFGLVTIPVSIMPATESHSIAFRQIHTADGGRIRNRKICEECGKSLDQSQIGRGYELPDGSLVEITDQDLDALPLESVRAIEVAGFLPWATIPLERIGRSYYLQAHGDIAAKPYTLIRRALQRNDKVAIARYSLRDRERYGLLRVRGDALVLHQLLAADEIRDPAALAPRETGVPDDELQGALELTEALTTDDLSNISDLTDHYTDALEKIITAKLEGKQPPPAEEEEQAPRAPVVDLMAALNASVDKARQARGETDDATVHEIPAKKTTAAAKKTTAKRAPAAAEKSASGRPRKRA